MASAIASDVPGYGVGALFPDLHSESHGESFLDLALSRFLRPGLYILDDLEVVQLWRRFLDHPDSVLHHLLTDE